MVPLLSKTVWELRPGDIPSLEAPRIHKDWHKMYSRDSSINPVYSRKYQVLYLVRAFMGFGEFNDDDPELNLIKIINYAKRIELECFETADKLSEYTRLVDDNVGEIKKNLSDETKSIEFCEIVFESSRKAKNTLERNTKIIEGIENEELRKKVQEQFRCGICTDGLKLYSCSQCWNALCRNCYYELKKHYLDSKCHYCQHENPTYDFVVLPRL